MSESLRTALLCHAMPWQLLSVAAVTTGEGKDKTTIAGECVWVFVCVLLCSGHSEVRPALCSVG